MLLALLALPPTLVRGTAMTPRKFHITKAAQRFSSRGIGGESTGDELVHFRLEVKAELVIEVALDVAPPEAEIPSPQR